MKRSLILLLILSLVVPVLFLGCEGDDGAQGPQGIQGPTGPTGPTGPEGPAAPTSVTGESCAICHNGDFARNGNSHQAAYDQLYQDNVIRVTGVTVTQPADNVVVTTFTMTKNGAAFNCQDADSVGIYFTPYDATSGRYVDTPISLKPSATSVPAGSTTTVGNAGTGLCTVTATFTDNVANFTGSDGLVVVYGRDEKVADNIPNSRVVQYKYPFAGLEILGTADAYVSAANASAPEGVATLDGCERCHTVPFLKHGYIYGRVDHVATTDFYTCKACHYDNRVGGHYEWQIMASDPDRWAAIMGQVEADPGSEFGEFVTAAEKTQYAYQANLMNDVHMSHSMEFLYPQSMSNCVVCHKDKLDLILTDANFKYSTCKSCHPVTTTKEENEITQAPALTTIWTDKGVLSFHQVLGPTATCADVSSCHQTGGAGKSISAIHSGYDEMIYDDAGTKYSSAIAVTIDNASFVDNNLTIGFSATGSLAGLNAADIVPTVLIGLYGYDSKDFIVSPHNSDIPGTGRNLEFEVGVDNNVRFTVVKATGGSWEIIADLSHWADRIADKSVKRVEIAVTPLLTGAEGPVALNGVSRTFDLGANAFDDSFLGSHNSIANADKCNNCHDALATTFHTNDPGRGGNIVVCRLCHTTLNGGSHLEMQSRSIDSYVHAIHSFQAFDLEGIDLTVPLERFEYLHHIESHFPTFGTENCLACHNASKFNVPDQSKSMPGLLSKSETLKGGTRNIGTVPYYFTGPGTRACGACHRAHEITADEGLGDAGELSSLFSHWSQNGYLIDEGTGSAPTPVAVAELIDPIMVMF